MSNHADLSASPKFGTFGGVFVPNVLTILGVILFMRTGWVVGQAGLFQALLILCVANSITVLTSLSLSAIATNTKVGSGGAYFMVSRSLGLEVGGSIGVPLFLAQAISVAFYAIGFSESLRAFFPDLNVQFVAAGIIAGIFLVTLIGSSLAIKAQFFIFGILVLSLVSFFAGGGTENHFENNITSHTGPEAMPFWAIFAIFFPAVTGIMSGASMSGDLKNPSRSIPMGTLGAVAVTFVVYGFLMWWLARNAERADLIGDPLVMNEISRVPALIYAGLWAATLSSALASLLAAPRTLQALASDGVLPKIFARKSGKNGEPRVALVFSFVLALCCVAIGDLNAIAPVISMFFLATYSILNFIGFLEKIVSNPSYRPTFQVHWLASLIGFLGCVAVMFLLSPLATVVAIILIIGLHLYLTQRRYRTAWGDMRSGIWFSLTRFSLLRFQDSHKHLRNWRPVILVLAGNPAGRPRLVEFASLMEARCGFLFLAQILVGPWKTLLPRIDGARQSIQNFIDEKGYSAVPQVVASDSFDEGVTSLIQATGVGPITPNTVLIGWSSDEMKQQIFQDTVNRVLLAKKNLVFYLNPDEEFVGRLDKTVDIWWRSKRNGVLMATLAHLICSNPTWNKHAIRIFMIIENEEGINDAQANMAKQLEELRIDADVRVITSSSSIRETIQEHSKFSDICFLGINLEPDPEKAGSDPVYYEIEKTNADLKGNVFVTRSWESLDSAQ